MSDRFYYAIDIVAPGVTVPEAFSKSLTISGLISHGRKRCPLEWAFIDPRLLIEYLASDHPHDRDKRDILKGIRDFVADRAHAK
jgi:hypothetical protein